MSVLESTATELLAELTAGNVTATELTQAYLGQIEKHDGAIGAFLNVDADRALSRAKGIDKRAISKLLNVAPNTLYSWLKVRRPDALKPPVSPVA